MSMGGFPFTIAVRTGHRLECGSREGDGGRWHSAHLMVILTTWSWPRAPSMTLTPETRLWGLATPTTAWHSPSLWRRTSLYRWFTPPAVLTVLWLGLHLGLHRPTLSVSGVGAVIDVTPSPCWPAWPGRTQQCLNSLSGSGQLPGQPVHFRLHLRTHRITRRLTGQRLGLDRSVALIQN